MPGRGARLIGAGCLLALILSSPPAQSQQVPVVEKTLSNGMRVLMVPRKDEPTVAGGWVAHVGSSNERPGITGTAHLFEHMMFKGTVNIGSTNAAQDIAIIDEQEKIRDEMRAEEAKLRAAWRRGEISDITSPENMTPRWIELKKRFDELVVKQRSAMVKNEFDLIYKNAGGTGMNAYTSEDMTVFFVSVPANKLELWMWMESDRLFHPVFREFYSERDVVFEERRMRVESRPLGKFSEELGALFWQSTPYHWPVIGWPSDIPAISKKQADEFFTTYYAPQNISVVLVGDFDPEKTLALAERYFGRIPRGAKPAPEVITTEVKQEAEKRMNAEADANPMVDILWHTVPFGHKDSYILSVLGELLSNRTGRLYKGLVLGSQTATDVSAGQDSRKWAGCFEVEVEVREGKTPAELENGIYAEIDKLKDSEVPAEELQKVKNNFAAAQYRRLTDNMSILQQALSYEGEGNWREINEENSKIQAVTAADIQRVAKLYLTKENRSVATYTRKSDSKPAAAPQAKEQK